MISYYDIYEIEKGSGFQVDKIREQAGVQIYNLGTGNGYSVLEIVNAFEKANNINFLIHLDLTKPIEIKAKVRYRAKPAEAILEIDLQSNQAIVNFKEPQRAVTKGQSVVFYIDDDIVLGGGIII